jgi:hypothetical protein
VADDDALIPDILPPEVAASAALAVKPRGKPAPQPIGATCRVCGRATLREQLNLCAEHAHVQLAADEDKALVRKFLEKHQHRAAELWVEGAERAAMKGDTGPAERILLHTKVIEPVKQNVDLGSGITINLGVVLPHCGEPPA